MLESNELPRVKLADVVTQGLDRFRRMRGQYDSIVRIHCKLDLEVLLLPPKKKKINKKNKQKQEWEKEITSAQETSGRQSLSCNSTSSSGDDCGKLVRFFRGRGGGEGKK